LVLNFPKGEARYRSAFPEWEQLPLLGLFVEMERFLGKLELTRTIFRSDHVSNRLVLKGTLNTDKPLLLAKIRKAIADPGAALLRPVWRGGF
jgi:hypothetical protein